VSDSWLERGHGANAAHLTTLFSSDGQWPGEPERTPPPEGTDRARRRSSRVAVAAALWVAIVAGTGGAAWAVRDALFPSIGPAEVSVWQNPGRETTPATTEPSTSVVATAPVDDPLSTEATVPTSVEGDPAAPSPSVSDDGDPGHGGATNTSVGPSQTTVDDHGGGNGSGDSSDSGSSGKSGGSGGSGSGGSGSGGSGSGGSGSGGSGSGESDGGSDG
jgi:hypothetical protein